MVTTAYTDGSCIGNPGPGGWAWAVPGGAFASGAEAASTNQRMEVRAALEAVTAIDGPLRIVSDSKYVVDCFDKQWWVGWEAKGWMSASRKPVANQDLWRPLIEIYRSRQDAISFEWVKGHSGDEMNDVVDRLATEAAATQKGRSGSEPPTELGPADAPRGSSGSTGSTSAASVASTGGRRGLVGWLVVVIGHRPPELGGYDADNPVSAEVRRKLRDVFAAWRTEHPDLVVVTGLGLGTGQLAAEAAAAAGVAYVAVLAHPDPDSVWPASSRQRFGVLRDAAASVITLEPRAPRSKQEAGMAGSRRDAWMLAAADAAVVVWDGQDLTLRDALSSLERRIDDVVLIRP